MFPKCLPLVCLFAVASALVGGVHVFQPAEGAITPQEQKLPEISKKLRKYDLLKLDRKSVVSQIRRTGKLVLKTSHHVFDFQLFPHDLRSTDYRSQVIGSDGVARPLPSTPVITYRGFERDQTGAQVRLTVTDDSIEGAIITPSNRYFIQPARTLSKAAGDDEFLVYDAQDLNEGAWQCGVTLADQVAAQEKFARTSIDSGKTPIETKVSSDIGRLNPERVVRLATEADAEYVSAMGGATQANNHILSIMNQVDGIYQVELGLTFQIVFQNAWTNAATDPYTSTDPFVLIREFETYWNGNFTGVSRDIAHLWTGKDVIGVLGVAFLGTVCRPSESYGLTVRLSDPLHPVTAGAIAVTAHEIAHNFGAVHTSQPGPQLPPEVGDDCRGSFMQVLSDHGMTFCTFTRSQILNYVENNGTCLSESAASPPVFPACVDVPITPGVVVNGSFAPTDCRSPARGIYHFADRYAFDGQAGQRLNIAMIVEDLAVGQLIYLIGPDGVLVAQEGNRLGNTVRLPMSGSFTLPADGKYIIEVTSFIPLQTGNYTLALSLDGCVLSVNPLSQHFSQGGGSGTINVTATGGGCGANYQFTVWPNSATWITRQSTTGSGSQTLSFNVDPNLAMAGRRAFLVIGAAVAGEGGGLLIPITQSGSTPDCVLSPIRFGETIDGVMSTTDCLAPNTGNTFSYADRYVFIAAAGDEVAIISSRPPGSTFITLFGPNGRAILNAVGGGPVKARIPGGPGMLKLGAAGEYVIEVTSSVGTETGPYSLTLINNAPPVLLTQENSDKAIAMESVSLLRDPFPLTTSFLNPDQQTRIMLFASNLGLLPDENPSAVTATAEDNQLNSYPLTVEFVGKVQGLGWMAQVVVKLPPNLPSGQDVRVSIALHGRTSNKVRLAIK